MTLFSSRVWLAPQCISSYACDSKFDLLLISFIFFSCEQVTISCFGVICGLRRVFGKLDLPVITSCWFDLAVTATHHICCMICMACRVLIGKSLHASCQRLMNVSTWTQRASSNFQIVGVCSDSMISHPSLLIDAYRTTTGLCWDRYSTCYQLVLFFFWKHPEVSGESSKIFRRRCVKLRARATPRTTKVAHAWRVGAIGPDRCACRRRPADRIHAWKFHPL